MLGTVNSATVDRDAAYWEAESRQLRSHFDRRVRERIASGEIGHVSVFGLAPQPLLVLFGAMLGDILPASIYQLHREPRGWTWPEARSAGPILSVREPADTNGPPALIFSLSGTITAARVTAVLGPDARIWMVTIPKPNNDYTKSREQLTEFRAAMRTLLDRIKSVHGQTTPLHVFPAMSASFAIEFGRVRMPKADTTWHLYDQVNSRGGFVQALSISQGD